MLAGFPLRGAGYLSAEVRLGITLWHFLKGTGYRDLNQEEGWVIVLGLIHPVLTGSFTSTSSSVGRRIAEKGSE